MKIIIADDQPLIREGLAALLGMNPEIEVAGAAENGREAYELVRKVHPDIVLMDIRMPVTDGIEGTRKITAEFPETKVLMLTTFKDSELIFQALQEGASGYLLKDISADSIIKAMMTVQAGGIVLPPELTGSIIREIRRQETAHPMETVPAVFQELSQREIEVLRLLGYGHSNKEIADELFITEGTVKNHVSNIISKLQVRDRTQSAIFAVRYGITVYS